MTNEQVTTLLMILLMILLFVIIVLGCIYFIILNKKRKNKTTETQKVDVSDKESVFNFMEFDKIEDNMVIQKNGARYLMIIQCQGVNYDLMSNVEKNSVEEGFVQFLNTLRHPIQLYIQTRTVNLESSIKAYKARMTELENQLNKIENEYRKMARMGDASQEDLQKAYYEIVKQRNLYEYGKDVIYNTEMMSLNKNVLNKQYFIIIPYYPSELGSNDYDREEIKNIAFSELYTRAQSIVRTLFACNVEADILDSVGLMDLLYVAYNRDDSEVYGMDKILAAGYEELYSTAPDVLDKKMEELDRQIEREAMAKINEKILEVQSEKEKKLLEKEKSLDDLVDEMAKLILDNSQGYIQKDVAKKAKEKIENDAKNRKKTSTRTKKTDKIKEGEDDIEKEKAN